MFLPASILAKLSAFVKECAVSVHILVKLTLCLFLAFEFLRLCYVYGLRLQVSNDQGIAYEAVWYQKNMP